MEYLRVDSLSANVYRYDPYPSPRDVLKDSLRATPGSSFYSEWGFQTVCLSIDTLTVLGVPTTVKTFRQEFIHGAVYLLAYGFGRIRYVSFEEDPCYPLLYSVVTDLVYAKIDGREYGTFVNVQEKEESLPVLTQVSQNYPNPFNPMTNIEYRIENAGFVSLKVYDMLGREVATLVNEQINPGTYQVIWDATGMPSGVYFYRLRAGELTETRKLMLLR